MEENHSLSDSQLIDKVFQIIEEQYSNSEFNINDVAAELGISRSTFFKKVKRHTKRAPVDLIKHVRLTIAMSQLRRTDKPISEVAAVVGFKDPNYFGKCFRKECGLTPKEFRQKHRSEQ